MNKIYDLINDTKFNLNEYPVDTLSEFEKKQMKNQFRKMTKNKKFALLPKVSVAAVAVLGLLISGSVFGNKVLADVSIFGISIEEFIPMIHYSLADYKTIVNQTVTSNDITVKFNEVIIDDDRVLLNATFNSSKFKWTKQASVDQRVYINGKDILYNGGGGGTLAKIIDDTSCNFFSSVEPSNQKTMNLSGENRIKIIYDNLRVGDESYKGKWIFEFTANKDKLTAKIKTYPINKTITIDNGPVVTIKNITTSPIYSKIHYLVTDFGRYSVSFNMKDQNGNILPSDSASSRNEVCVEAHSIIDENVTKLTITPILKAYKKPEGNSHEEVLEYKKELTDQAFDVNIK